MAKRKLADLYVRGTEVKLENGDDYAVVWCRKLNPVDHRECVRKGDAARARTVAVRNNKDSDEYQATVGMLADFSRERLTDILCMIEQMRVSPLKESEVADEKEWKDESYLEGLRDSWSEISDKDSEDEDTVRIRDELTRFADKCKELVEYEIENFREGLSFMSLDEITDKAIEQELKNAAEQAWVHAYYRYELFLGVRTEKDHKKQEFASIEEVDDLDPLVFTKLNQAFRDLTLDPQEGKG